VGKGKVGIEGFERVAYLNRGINVDPGGLGSPIKSSADLAPGSKAPMNLHLKTRKSAHFQSFLRCQFWAEI
jgi:hypothetical protein